MKRLLLEIILLAVLFGIGFGIGYRCGRRSVEVRTVTRIDTVFYEKPQAVGFSDRLVRVNVPRLLFAPRDTVVIACNDGGNGESVDSVRMEIPVRTLEYRDSTYCARISGPVVGTLAPRLDWIETYNRTVTQTVTRRPRFAVTAGVGVGYTPQGFQPVVGVQAGVVLWSK